MYNHKDGISLRKIERTDLPDLLALKSESWWGTHKTLIINKEDQERWFDNIPSDQLYLIAQRERLYDRNTPYGQAVQINEKVEPVGVAVYTDIDWIGRTLSISGSIYRQCRKPDVVKHAFSAGLDFAFEMLNMFRVQAEVLSFNSAAQALEISHLGFSIEGVRKKAIYKAGRYYDSIVLGLLREEWEKQERVTKYSGSCCQFDHQKAEKFDQRFHNRLTQAVRGAE